MSRSFFRNCLIGNCVRNPTDGRRTSAFNTGFELTCQRAKLTIVTPQVPGHQVCRSPRYARGWPSNGAGTWRLEEPEYGPAACALQPGSQAAGGGAAREKLCPIYHSTSGISCSDEGLRFIENKRCAPIAQVDRASAF
jgi:hypothetical protein